MSYPLLSRLASGRHIFFTVNLLQWQDNDLLIRHIDSLRDEVDTRRNALRLLAPYV